MKANAALLATVFIVLTLVAGCGAAAPAAPSGTRPSASTAAATQSPPTDTPPLTTEQASRPALAPTATLAPGAARTQIGDFQMYYETYGQGEPLLLLGGAGGSTIWTNQVRAFGQKYRVIAPDSRGQARSTDAEQALSYELMTADTLQLMDQLGIASAYVVGHSDGGIIGLELAIHHPERVKALVAYGANSNPEGLTPTALRDGFPDELRQLYLQIAPDPAHYPVMVAKVREMWRTQPNITAAELGSIKIPTLILDGEQEELVRTDHTQYLAKAIPGAQLKLLPGVGHFGPLTKPGPFNSVVLDFLEDK